MVQQQQMSPKKEDSLLGNLGHTTLSPKVAVLKNGLSCHAASVAHHISNKQWCHQWLWSMRWHHLIAAFPLPPPGHLLLSHYPTFPTCLLRQPGHLPSTSTRQFNSKLVVNGLDCTVWRPHFFSIKTFYFFRGFAFNVTQSSVTGQLINVCYYSLLHWRSILWLFYISRHTVCLKSPALIFPSLFYIHYILTCPLLLCITGTLAIKHISLDSSIFKTPQVFSQNPFYFLPSEVY